ncbi:hypothetical protein BDAP_002305 [Binucleata daphniae]
MKIASQKYVLIFSILTIIGNLAFSAYKYKGGKRFKMKTKKTLDDYLEMNGKEIEKLCKSVDNTTKIGSFEVWKDKSITKATKNNNNNTTNTKNNNNNNIDVTEIMFIKKKDDLLIYCSKKNIEKVVNFDKYVTKINADKKVSGDEMEIQKRFMEVLREKYDTTGYCKAMIKENKCYLLFDSGPAYVFTHKGEDEVYKMFGI